MLRVPVINMICTALLLVGCATVPLPTRSVSMGEAGGLGRCADFFHDLDRRIRESAAIDGGLFRVPGYPYLRVDRFMASFGQEIDDSLAFDAWVDHMQGLDQEARRLEIANLPPGESRDNLNRQVGVCGDLLMKADFQDQDRRDVLKKKVSTPDEYIELRRLAGLYPLTRWFVSLGVSDWHIEAREAFSLQPPTHQAAIRYLPAQKSSGVSAQQILARMGRDPLGIPLLTAEDREQLFRLHAPVWEVELLSDADRIGTPLWRGPGVTDVNIQQPRTYTRLSFTRFNHKVLIQLNYIIWFPSRPKTGILDIYGGNLDGLNYRITLDETGRPLLYETIHNCGCFYKAFPTPRLQVRDAMGYAEKPLILDAPEVDPAEAYLTISMTGRTHYVEHLYPLSRQGATSNPVYDLAAYDQLRSLPRPGASPRSMFDATGIAPGSERLERFILWPMGVASPGGMRQWGRHAVSFIGKRHFDDPFYMDRMYFPVNPQ